MRNSSLGLILAFAAAANMLSGCHSRKEFFDPACTDHYQAFATEVEEPCSDVEPRQDLMTALQPHTVRGAQPTIDWPLKLEDAVQLSLTNSEVIRDVGGRVLNASTFGNVSNFTVYDAALADANPNTGQEAALSAFDAQLVSAIQFNRNQRTLNNVFFGGGIAGVRQNTSNFLLEVNKTAATGSQFALRNYVDYDRNNSTANRFPSVYNAILEAEVRQPLLQGAGLEYNRIAGPNATPGNYNGVILARLNTDIALTAFEQSVRDLLMEVERTYWQLYFAYRDLDAKMARRDTLLQAWRVEQDRLEAGISKQQDEALAREQYYLARADVENALSGTATSGLVVGTSAGVYTVERRLRLLMGLPTNDGRLIRPADDPSMADVVFDWGDSVVQASTRRVELRRQKWNIKRREMELLASRNFLKMRLDFLGQYRWRGFGDELLSDTNVQNGSAYEDLFGGQLQEWQMGLQLSTPIGNRIGHTAVRHAELLLARDRAVYREQELQVLHDLSAAFAEVDRAYSVTRSYYNSRVAAYQRLHTVRAEYEANEVLLRDLLDAQGQATEADSNYYRALVDYNLAVTNLHLQRGTLLDYMGVQLAEGPWTPEAYESGAKQSRRFRSRTFDYGITKPCPVSAGPYPQSGAEEVSSPEAEGWSPVEGQPRPADHPAGRQPEIVKPLEELEGLDPAVPDGATTEESILQPRHELLPSDETTPRNLPPSRVPPREDRPIETFEPDAPENMEKIDSSAQGRFPARANARLPRPLSSMQR